MKRKTERSGERWSQNSADGEKGGGALHRQRPEMATQMPHESRSIMFL